MDLYSETLGTVLMTLRYKKLPHWRLCPVQRPLGEYVRSSEESCCKCHARMSICRYFPSAKQWGMYCFAVHRRHAKAQSNCRGAGFWMFGALRKRSWRGAMRSFFCMYKKGGTPMGHQRHFCPSPASRSSWGGNLVMIRYGNTSCQMRKRAGDQNSMHVLVFSRDFFNRPGIAVVCPVRTEAFEEALRID